MNVKLTPSGGMAGTGFEFKPGQVIKCSERTGKRLIEHGIGTEAPAGAPVDGEMFDSTPEELVSPAKKGTVEKAVRPAAETPETNGNGAKADAATCSASTAQGNPCKRAPVAGSDRCAGHSKE